MKIAELIKTKFEWFEDQAKIKGYFHHKALEKVLLDTIQPLEKEYIKRIEELEEKEKVYDFFMKLPFGETLQISRFSGKGEYADSEVEKGEHFLIEFDEKEYYGKTPIEIILNYYK